jgi:serine/threonine protein kinase
VLYGTLTFMSQQRFIREALTWRLLCHSNILPFLGVDAVTFESSGLICLVSPWMEHGTALDYVTKRPRSMSDIIRLVSFTGVISPTCSVILQLRGVACGLVYLHRSHLVHGDIRGVCSARASARAYILIFIIGEHLHGRV